MIYYSYDEFKEDVKILAKEIRQNYEPNALVAIARGGLSLGHSLAVALNTRQLFSLNSIHYEESQKLNSVEIFNVPDLSAYSKILLIDDIVDSGESLSEIKKLLRAKFPQTEFKTASIFYKKTALFEPDFKVKEAKDWIDFFWDIRLD